MEPEKENIGRRGTDREDVQKPDYILIIQQRGRLSFNIRRCRPFPSYVGPLFRSRERDCHERQARTANASAQQLPHLPLPLPTQFLSTKEQPHKCSAIAENENGHREGECSVPVAKKKDGEHRTQHRQARCR